MTHTTCELGIAGGGAETMPKAGLGIVYGAAGCGQPNVLRSGADALPLRGRHERGLTQCKCDSYIGHQRLTLTVDRTWLPWASWSGGHLC